MFVAPTDDDRNFSVKYSVTIPCLNPMSFKDVSAWANQIKNNPIEQNYQFYGSGGDNCSTYILRGLTAAGADKVHPFKANLLNMITPKDVFNYAKVIESKQRTRELEEQLKLTSEESNIKYTREKRTSIMLELTATKIESFIRQCILENNANQPNEDGQLLKDLESIVKKLINFSDRIKMQEGVSLIIQDANIKLSEDWSNLFLNHKINGKIYNKIEKIMPALSTLRHFLNLNTQHCNSIETILTNTQQLFTAHSEYALHKNGIISNINTTALHIEDNSEWDTYFRKNIVINSAIAKIMKNTKDTNHTSNLKLIRNQHIKQLKKIQGANNAFIYFDQYGFLPDDKLNLFKKLNDILPSKDINQYTSLITYKDEQINSLQPQPEFKEIPFRWWNPLERWKNHKAKQSYQAQQYIYDQVQSSNLGLDHKIARIETCINDHKPSWWESIFWGKEVKKNEEKKYEELGFKAKIICTIQSFTNGEIDIIDFANQLKKLAKRSNCVKSNELKTFANAVISSYAHHIELCEKKAPLLNGQIQELDKKIQLQLQNQDRKKLLQDQKDQLQDEKKQLLFAKGQLQYELKLKKEMLNLVHHSVTGEKIPNSKQEPHFKKPSLQKAYSVLFSPKKAQNADTNATTDLVNDVRKIRKHLG
jgi:hypothetical protein